VGFAGEVLGVVVVVIVVVVEGCTSVASVRHGCGIRLTVGEKKLSPFSLFVFFLCCIRFLGPTRGNSLSFEHLYVNTPKKNAAHIL